MWAYWVSAVIGNAAVVGLGVTMPSVVGTSVTVVVAERQVHVLYAGQDVASHAQNAGRRTSIIERSHLAGIVGAQAGG